MKRLVEQHWGAALRSTEWWALGAVETRSQCTRAHLRSMGKEGIEALFSLQKGFKEGLLAGCQVPFSHP